MNIEQMAVAEFTKLNEMTNEMLDRDILQFIKGNMSKPQKTILRLLKKEFPDVYEYELCASLQRLIERT